VAANDKKVNSSANKVEGNIAVAFKREDRFNEARKKDHLHIFDFDSKLLYTFYELFPFLGGQRVLFRAKSIRITYIFFSIRYNQGQM
jgi:hypothetical protein